MTWLPTQNTFRLSRIIIGFVFLFLIFSNCNIEQESFCDVLCIPEGFPDVVFPDSNSFTKERWELGKKLFYEKQLSIDSSISCSSCHLPQFVLLPKNKDFPLSSLPVRIDLSFWKVYLS